MWTMDKDRMPPDELFTQSYIVCPTSSLITYITGQREETLPFKLHLYFWGACQVSVFLVMG
jgi:hypothetical protein